jgi:hypothetical protein
MALIQAPMGASFPSPGFRSYPGIASKNIFALQGLRPKAALSQCHSPLTPSSSADYGVTVKRLLAQEAQAGINGAAAPGFEHSKTQCIKLRGSGQHLGSSHARGRHGLMTVVKDRVVENDGDVHGQNRYPKTCCKSNRGEKMLSAPQTTPPRQSEFSLKIPLGLRTLFVTFLRRSATHFLMIRRQFKFSIFKFS